MIGVPTSLPGALEGQLGVGADVRVVRLVERVVGEARRQSDST